jgi:hypothetical protein
MAGSHLAVAAAGGPEAEVVAGGPNAAAACAAVCRCHNAALEDAVSFPIGLRLSLGVQGRGSNAPRRQALHRMHP